MKLKKTMLVSLILLAILMIGAVSAADTSDELAVSDSSGDVIEASLDNEKLSDMSPDNVTINVKDIDTTDSSANFTTISVSEKDGEYVICTGENENTVEIYKEDLSSSDRDYDDGGKYCFGVSLEDVNKYISDNVKGKNTFQEVIDDGDIVRFVFEYHGNDFAELSYLVKYDNDMISFLPAPFDFEESLRRVFPFVDSEWVAVLEMESPGEGKFNVTVTNSTGNYTITRELTDDDKVEFMLEDLNITEMGVYEISVKYISPSGDETDVITEESVIVTEAIVPDQFDIRDDDANLVSVYCPDSSSDYIIVVKVYNVDDDEDEKFIDEFEHVIQSEDYGKYHNWKLSDFGITESSGEFFKFRIYILQDPNERPDDDENKLEEIDSQAIDSTKFRMEVQGHMNLLSTEPVVFVFCPEGSTGWVALNIYREDENENFIFVKSSTKNINLKDENNWLNWTLDELKIGDGNYKVMADVHNDTEEYQYTEEFEVHNPIDIADGPVFIGTDLEDRTRIVEIEIPSDMDATIIIKVNGTEEFRNATSDFVKKGMETTPENLTWHYAYRNGHHVDNFKVYVITTVNMGYAFTPDVYNIEVVVETAVRTVNRQADVNIVEVKSVSKDGYTIEIYDADEYDLWDDEWSFASVSSPEGTKGKVKVTIAEDDQWLWEKDFEDHIDINPNEIGLLAGTYEMTVSAYDENGEFVLNNTASITFNYGEVGFMDSEVSEPMEYDDNWGIKIHFLIEDISGQLVIKFDDVTYYDGHVDTKDYEYDWEHNPYIIFSAKHLGVQPGNYDNVTISYSGDDGVEDADVHKDIEVKPYKPQIYIRYSDWESKKAQFPADDENQFIGVHVNGDDFSKVRIVVKIGDEVCLDAMLEDLGLKENYNPDGDQYYYDIGLSLLNKTFKIGEHYDNVSAFYHSDNYDLDTIEASREGNCPDFFDVIGIADEIDMDNDSYILYVIGDKTKDKVTFHISGDNFDDTFESDIDDSDDDKFMAWKYSDFNLAKGYYHIEAKYDDNDEFWIFDSDFSVVNKSEFYAIMECDWFFTTDAVIKVWCPVDATGIIKIIDRDGKGITEINHTITGEEKGTYVEFTLADLNITRPDWYGIDIEVNNIPITGPEDGLDVPSPIEMPNNSVYLPEVGFYDDESMKIAELALPSDASGNVVITIDGTECFNENIDDMEYSIDGPKNIYRIYTSSLGNSAVKGLHNVVVTFNEFTESRTLDFRERNIKSENGITIIILDGNVCAYWGDVVVEIIAPKNAKGNVVVKLNDSKVAEWDEINGIGDCGIYDEDNLIYYIHTYDIFDSKSMDLGTYHINVTYDDSISNEDDILFMGDHASGTYMWAESDETGFVALDNTNWIHFRPDHKKGNVNITIGGQEVFSHYYDGSEDEYLINPSDLGIYSPVSYDNIIFAFYDEDDCSIRYWKIQAEFISEVDAFLLNDQQNFTIDGRIIDFHVVSGKANNGVLIITIDGTEVFNKALSKISDNETYDDDYFYHIYVSDLDNIGLGHYENIAVSYTGDGCTYSQDFVGYGDYDGNIYIYGCPNFVINVTGSVFGEPIIVNVTAEEYFTGDVVVKIGDVDVNVEVQNGEGINDTILLPAGEGYMAYLNFDETGYYLEDHAESNEFNVDKAESSIEIKDIGAVTYPDDVEIEYTTNSTVTVVAVYVKGTTTEVGTVTQGNKKVTVSGLGAGNYTVSITAEDENHSSNTSSKNFTVDPKDNEVYLSIGDTHYSDYINIYISGVQVAGTYVVTCEGNTVNVDVSEVSPGVFEGSTSVRWNLAVGTGYEASVSLDNSNYTTWGADLFDITPKDNPVTLTIGNVEYGEKVLVEISNAFVAGTYKVNLTDGKYVDVVVNDASVSILSGSAYADWDLAVGTGYSASVSLDNSNYTTGGSTTFDVTAKDNAVTLTIDNVEYGSPVAVSITGAKVAGTYVVTCEGKTVNVDVSEVSAGVFSGSANADWDLAVHTGYSAGVSLVNSNYTTSGGDTFDVTAIGSDVTVPASTNVDYGGSVVVRVTAENDTGVDAKLYNAAGEQVGSVSISGYDITVNVAGLAINTYTLNVTTLVDGNHSSVTKSGSIVIGKASSSVTVPEVAFNYGGSQTVTVTVTNSTGAITAELLNLDGTKVTAGTAEVNDRDVTVSGLAAGSYILKVTVAADDHYNGSVGNNSVVVAKTAPPALTVENIAPIAYGESIVINASLTGDYNVTVDDGTPIAVAGVVAGENKTVAIGKYAVGDHTVKVQFVGNQNYTESNVVSTGLTVNQAVPALTVGDIAPMVYGSNSISIVVNYDGDYNLTVDGGAPINLTGVVAGVAKTVNVGVLTAGTHSLKVQFKGDENYTVSNVVEKSLIVNNKVTPAIYVSSKDVNYPEDVVVTVNGEATGTYTIRVGSQTIYKYLSGGHAQSFAFKGLDINEKGYRIFVSFPGDDRYNYAENNNVVVKVLPPLGPRETVLNATASVTGDAAIIKITLADVYGYKLTKMVNVKVGNYVGDVNVTNGEGSLTLNNLNVGTYTADVKFAGDENYTNSSASTSFEIKPVYPTAAIITPSVETTYKDAVVKVTLTDKYGAKLNGVVTVTVGNDTSNVTVTNGEGSLALSNLAVGFYSANVAYAGDANHTNASSVVSFAISNAVLLANDTKRGWNSPYDYYATLVDINGKPIAGKDITFTIDGTAYKATTDADGIAKVVAKLDVGTHSVVATNPDTGANFTVTAVIVERIQGYGDITKDYLGPESYVVQIFGDDGNPVGEGEVVQVRFAGKTYNMTTNASGYIVRTINFVPGSYAVYSIYAGYQTPQTGITVKQILKVPTVTAKKSDGYVTLQATLKSSSGKAIKGKIVFTFRGNTYKANTNSKGIASYKIEKASVLSGLKAGKKYKVKAKYENDSVTGTVVVKK